MILAIAAALTGAVGYGAASVLQAAAASRATGTRLWRHPLYLGGLLTDAAAWIASLVALRQLPVFAVQALLAGSLAITVLLASAFLDTHLRRRDVMSVGGIVLALAIIAAAASSAPPTPPGPALAPIAVGSALATAVILLALFKRGHSTTLAIVAGIAFSGAAVSARGLGSIHGWFAIVTNPLSAAVLLFGVAGVIAYGRALEGGNVGASTAMMWVVEVVLPGLIGLAVLGDRVRPGWAVPAVFAVAAAIIASLVLATSPAGTTALE